MRFVSIWILLASVVSLAPGAFEPKCTPRGGALGGLLTLPPWSATAAPGGEAFLIFSPGLFSLPELSISAGGFSWFDGSSAFAIGISRFGGELYRELEGSATAEFAVDSLARIGGKLSLLHLRIAGYGAALVGALSIQGGVRLFRDLEFRFGLLNLFAGRPGPDPVPREMGSALTWAPDRWSRIYVEARLESGQDAAWSAGAELEPVDGFWIRAGSGSDHPGIDGGVGIEIHPIRFDYSFRWHRDLGGSHLIGFSFATF